MLPKRRDAALKTSIQETRMDVERQLKNLQTKRCKDNLPPAEKVTFKTTPAMHPHYNKTCRQRIRSSCVEQGRLYQGSQQTIKQVRILSEASRGPNISINDEGETMRGLDVLKKADRQKKQGNS